MPIKTGSVQYVMLQGRHESAQNYYDGNKNEETAHKRKLLGFTLTHVSWNFLWLVLGKRVLLENTNELHSLSVCLCACVHVGLFM